MDLVHLSGGLLVKKFIGHRFTYPVTGKPLEICKTVRIVILNSLNSFFSIMNVLIDSLILKTLNSVLDIDEHIL